MRPQAAIAVVVMLVAFFLATLTGSWIAYAATLASAAWLAWVAADRVMQQVLDRPFDPDHARSTKP